MAAIPWMPLYIADYLADTGHLGTIDHGAYLLMMMHYWTKGPLPLDDGQLRKIVRMTPREWADARGVLLDFFYLEDGVYRHKRIDHEITTAEQHIDAKKIAGRAGGIAARGKSGRKPNTKTIADQIPNELQNNTPSPSPSPKTPSLRSGGARAKRRTSLPENCPSNIAKNDAVQFWGVHARFDLAETVDDEAEQFRDHHLKIGSVMADWNAAWRTWYRNTINPKFSRAAKVSAHDKGTQGAAEYLAEVDARNGARRRDGARALGDPLSANGHGLSEVEDPVLDVFRGSERTVDRGTSPRLPAISHKR